MKTETNLIPKAMVVCAFFALACSHVQAHEPGATGGSAQRAQPRLVASDAGKTFSQEDWRLYTEQNVTDKLKVRVWMDRHKALVARAQAASGSSDLEFFGDSITAGMSGNLDAFTKNFAQYNPQAFGNPGDTTEELMWRLAHGELTGNPKVVVVMIGANDLIALHAKSVLAIANNIAQIVKIIHSFLPGAKILLMAILPRGSAQDLHLTNINQKARQVNAEIARLDDGKAVRFIDIGRKFLDENGIARGDLLPDYLHPNRKGYEVWSDAIKPILDSMLQ